LGYDLEMLLWLYVLFNIETSFLVLMLLLDKFEGTKCKVKSIAYETCILDFPFLWNLFDEIQKGGER